MSTNKPNQKGEIVTILTVGTVIVLSAITLISSILLPNNKQTTSSKAVERCRDSKNVLGQDCDNMNKCDKNGGCNPACCLSTANSCPNQQKCEIPNGYCKSGFSCNGGTGKKQTCVGNQCVWQSCSGNDCNVGICTSHAQCQSQVVATPVTGCGGSMPILANCTSSFPCPANTTLNSNAKPYYTSNNGAFEDNACTKSISNISSHCCNPVSTPVPTAIPTVTTAPTATTQPTVKDLNCDSLSYAVCIKTTGCAWYGSTHKGVKCDVCAPRGTDEDVLCPPSTVPPPNSTASTATTVPTNTPVPTTNNINAEIINTTTTITTIAHMLTCIITNNCNNLAPELKDQCRLNCVVPN